MEKLRGFDDSHLEEMRIFLYEYKQWLTKSKVRLNDHPWAQYGHVEKPVTSYVITKS